jgi:hypothetical protein
MTVLEASLNCLKHYVATTTLQQERYYVSNGVYHNYVKTDKIKPEFGYWLFECKYLNDEPCLNVIYNN